MLPLILATATLSFGVSIVESYFAKKDAEKVQGEAEFTFPPQVKALIALLIGNTFSIGLVLLYLIVLQNKINNWEEDMAQEGESTL